MLLIDCPCTSFVEKEGTCRYKDQDKMDDHCESILSVNRVINEEPMEDVNQEIVSEEYDAIIIGCQVS